MKRRRRKQFQRLVFILLVIVILLLIGFAINSIVQWGKEIRNEKLRVQQEKIEKEKTRHNNIMKCLDSKEDDFKLSDDFTAVITEMSNKPGTYSIIYKEIRDNKVVLNYNGDYVFYGESTVKLPFAMYIYQLAKKDNTILDKVLYFKPANLVGGSGVMQNMDLSRGYKVRELVKYMIEESDNIAFYMLLDEFGKEEARKYWNARGSVTTFGGYDKFGTLCGNDALLYLEELNKLIDKGEAIDKELLSYTLAASKISIMKKVIKQEMYFKYGGPTSAYHELAIVDDDNKYVLAVLSAIKTVNYEELLTEIATKVKGLHTMYWQEKQAYCEAKYND